MVQVPKTHLPFQVKDQIDIRENGVRYEMWKGILPF